MRDLGAGLEREPERLRRLLAPTLEQAGRGEPAERVVDLDGVEDRRVVGEPSRGAHALRVEDAVHPLVVREAGGAQVEAARHRLP